LQEGGSTPPPLPQEIEKATISPKRKKQLHTLEEAEEAEQEFAPQQQQSKLLGGEASSSSASLEPIRTFSSRKRRKQPIAIVAPQGADLQDEDDDGDDDDEMLADNLDDEEEEEDYPLEEEAVDEPLSRGSNSIKSSIVTRNKKVSNSIPIPQKKSLPPPLPAQPAQRVITFAMTNNNNNTLNNNNNNNNTMNIYHEAQHLEEEEEVEEVDDDHSLIKDEQLCRAIQLQLRKDAVIVESPPSPASPLKKKKDSKRFACYFCRKAHTGCSNTRPCKRCTMKGLECFDEDELSSSPSSAGSSSSISSSNAVIPPPNVHYASPFPPGVLSVHQLQKLQVLQCYAEQESKNYKKVKQYVLKVTSNVFFFTKKFYY